MIVSFKRVLQQLHTLITCNLHPKPTVSYRSICISQDNMLSSSTEILNKSLHTIDSTKNLLKITCSLLVKLTSLSNQTIVNPIRSVISVTSNGNYLLFKNIVKM